MKPISLRISLLIFTIASIAAVLLCIKFIDGDAAAAIWKFTTARPFIHRHIQEISSPLPLLIAITTIPLWCAYFILSRQQNQGRHLQFIKLAATVIPAAYVVKEILQFIFGRVNTRYWLHTRGPIRFMWLNPTIGSSFPSGHTILAAAFLTAVWRYYPNYRLVSAAVFTALSAALLFSSYHFVSDVIAGGYCGVMLTIIVDRLLPSAPEAV